MNDCSFLIGKTALVTGASGGIGRAVCTRLSEMGLNLLVSGRDAMRLAETADALPGQDGAVELCAGDITAESFRKELIKTAEERFGGLDILINCAGIAQHESFETITPETFDGIMDINLRATFFLTQAALPLLKKSDCATIINMGSVVSHKGYPMQSVYTASKHALLGWSKALAQEVLADDIRVHVISPGGVYTEMIQLARPDLTPDGMTQPEDIASVVAFYLSMRKKDAVIDEIRVHRPAKEPFA